MRVDHSYQRPRQEALVRHYADEPRQRLAERVGLISQRSDGTLWVIDGQHHTAAAVDVGITALTYQQFTSSGPAVEARVYAALRLWHARHHEDERSKATKPGPNTRVPGMPQDHTVTVGG